MSLFNSSFLTEFLFTEINRLKQNNFSCVSLNSSKILDKDLNFLILSPNYEIPQTNLDLVKEKSNYEPVSNSTELEYDYQGSLFYILFVIFWYAICVICMIALQTKENDLEFYEDNYDSEINATNSLFRPISDDITKREALEELLKPGFRDKMWDIYSNTPNSYKIRKFENKKIQNMDRKLKQYYSLTPDFNRDTIGTMNSQDSNTKQFKRLLNRIIFLFQNYKN
ncbi:unnamed protein product [Brachionus calyciflorus]|uniref:Uncharacterized protein n=1 Tax=Brachionus calyciflorus TaxID=104777 RepID=A0A814DB19_9BILA|nr:unnamed protein product [Brachionus calyciflorus]